MAAFKEYILEEGELWDAVKHGVSKGVKAFRQKQQQQKNKSEQKTLMNQLMNAEGDELKLVIKKIVDNGYTIKGNGIEKMGTKPCHVNDWLYECTSTKMEYRFEK